MSINFYNKSLKRWNDSHPGEIESVFRSGMITAGDSMQQMKDKCFGTSTPLNEAKSALIGCISVFDKLGHSTRILLQNQAQTRALTIDILDEAYEAPSLEISKLSKSESIGPIIPVRYAFDNVEGNNVDKNELMESFMKSLRNMSLAKKSMYDNKSSGLKVEDDAIEVVMSWLESAAKNLSKECLDTFNQSELFQSGKFKMSYLHIIETVHSVKVSTICAQNSNCDNPNCKKGTSTSIKVCSVCRTPYCSKECQKEDW